MTGRLVWIEEDELDLSNWERSRILAAYSRSQPDAVAAFLEATRDRMILGDAEYATETIALGLRALGRPYPLADA